MRRALVRQRDCGVSGNAGRMRHAASTSPQPELRPEVSDLVILGVRLDKGVFVFLQEHLIALSILPSTGRIDVKVTGLDAGHVKCLSKKAWPGPTR